MNFTIVRYDGLGQMFLHGTTDTRIIPKRKLSPTTQRSEIDFGLQFYFTNLSATNSTRD